MFIRHLYLLFFVLCSFESTGAVTLRVQTVEGDSVFYAPVGDTVSVSVTVDSDTLSLAGVEVFLGYDPRLFKPVLVQGISGLLGRILVDTSFVISDSLAVIHVAEADLVGRPVAGTLFTVLFEVLETHSGLSTLGILGEDALRVSAYTEASRSGGTSPFESIRDLVFRDFPPVLALPIRFFMLEDDVLIVDLRTLAQDDESGSELLTWQVTSSDSLVAVVLTDTLTALIVPAPNAVGSAALTFSVTDPAGGVASRMVPLRVGAVNDAPQILLGALPDSLVLDERDAVIGLGNAAFDVDGDSLRWTGEGVDGVSVVITDNVTARVFAPLNWAGQGVVFLSVEDVAGEVAVHSVHVVRTVALNTLPGDFDGSGDVGFADFVVFAQAFGKENPPPEADLNGDGRVDFADFLIFVEHFGQKAN